jgi:hypothetical protein
MKHETLLRLESSIESTLIQGAVELQVRRERDDDSEPFNGIEIDYNMCCQPK